MGDKSGIEWTTATWNPTTGCDRISRGCDHCYALTQARRMKAMGQPAYQNDGDPRTSGPGFRLTLHPERLDQPLRWRRPRTIFVDSMSDLFHKDVPDAFLIEVWRVMAMARQHVFQVLTKRPKRMAYFVRDRDPLGYQGPLENVWLGTSVEDVVAFRRIKHLRSAPAAVRFLSVEPLIGEPVGLRPEMLEGIHWVIIGGESGPGARPLQLDWVEAWIAAARAAGAAVFVKQLGSVFARVNGGPPNGGVPAYWPEELRIRELPADAPGVLAS